MSATPARLGTALVGHLRGALAAPDLDLAGPLLALTGGYDTAIYALALRGAPAALAGPLVLRVLRPHHDPGMVLREQATQNTLAAQGYPAPHVLLASVDPAVLGAPFLLMERLPGTPLTRAGVRTLLRVLVELHLRLHALDVAPLRRALGETATFDGYLDALERRIAAASLTGLTPLLAWCRRARPPADGAAAVCHGDFHPENILVRDGVVTGVLDWPNALVADPAFDVASTLNIVTLVPATLASVAGPVRWLVRALQPLLAARYLAGYRRGRAIDDARLAYYRVAAGLRALVRAGESQRRPTGAPPTAFEASPYAARLLAQARRLSGVAAALP